MVPTLGVINGVTDTTTISAPCNPNGYRIGVIQVQPRYPLITVYVARTRVYHDGQSHLSEDHSITYAIIMTIEGLIVVLRHPHTSLAPDSL